MVEPTGAGTQVALRLGSQDVLASFPHRLAVRPGDRLGLRPLAPQAHLFDAASGQRLD